METIRIHIQMVNHCFFVASGVNLSPDPAPRGVPESRPDQVRVGFGSDFEPEMLWCPNRVGARVQPL